MCTLINATGYKWWMLWCSLDWCICLTVGDSWPAMGCAVMLCKAHHVMCNKNVPSIGKVILGGMTASFQCQAATKRLIGLIGPVGFVHYLGSHLSQYRQALEPYPYSMRKAQPSNAVILVVIPAVSLMDN